MVTPGMAQFLQQLRTRVKVGVVGGSDLKKIKEQLGEDGKIIPISVFIFWWSFWLFVISIKFSLVSGQFRILTGNRFLRFNGSVLWTMQLVCLVGKLDGHGWAIQLKVRFYKVATSSSSFTDIKYHISYQQIEYTYYIFLFDLFVFIWEWIFSLYAIISPPARHRFMIVHLFVCSYPELGLRVCWEWSCCLQRWTAALCPGKISLRFPSLQFFSSDPLQPKKNLTVL